jgi:hypothetical protein
MSAALDLFGSSGAILPRRFPARWNPTTRSPEIHPNLVEPQQRSQTLIAIPVGPPRKETLTP